MDGIARGAYIMYMVHYVYVIWTQYLLMGLGVFAGVKFIITFAIVVAASWATAKLLLRVPLLKRVL